MARHVLYSFVFIAFCFRSFPPENNLYGVESDRNTIPLLQPYDRTKSWKKVSVVSWPLSEEARSVEDHCCVPHSKGRNRRLSKFRIKFTFWWGLALLVGIKDAFWNWCLSLQSVSPIRRHFQRESVQDIWTNKTKQNKTKQNKTNTWIFRQIIASVVFCKEH